ncbi:MAG: DUF6129 family protein [Methylovirgula sp.]
MALSKEDIAEIERLLVDAGDADLFGALRQRFPKLFFTRCDASDVTEAPFASSAGFDVHLIDSADHCVQITADPARATGLVLARRSIGQ